MWHLFSAKRGADLLCGALLACFVLIMRINAQRHIDCGVSCEILNLLDIQPAFKQPCDVGMPELVRTTLECGAVVQRSAGSSTVRLSIVCRIDLKLLLDSGLPFLMCSTYRLFCALALLYKLCKQRGRYRNIPDCGRGLESVADGRLRVCEQRIVPNMNHTRGKINIRPHQPAKLSAPHTGLKCQQAEKICPRSSCRVQKALRLFSGERLPALLCRRFAKLPGLAILQSGCYPRLH